MRILHILPSIHTGGAEKFCVDLCNMQSYISDNDIYLCVLDRISDDQPLVQMLSPEVKLISFDKQGGYDLKVIFKVFKLLSKIKPDIIHLNGRAFVYASLPILLKQIPSIYTVHTMANKEYNKYIRKYLKFLFNRFPGFFTPVAISNSVSKTVQETYGKHHDTLIYNGSSKLELSSESTSVYDAVAKMKMNDDTRVFMYLGRIQKIKNTLLLIKAFNHLLQKGQNVCLLIIGYDPVPDQTYIELCKKTNLYPDKIKFLGRKENIADYLACADALCLTSTYEGLGIAALEGFSMGVPVLSTPSGGPSDIIISGVNGYVSKEITVESYTEILNDFIEKPLKNAEEIKSLYQNNYTMEVCANLYLKLYKSKLRAF